MIDAIDTVRTGGVGLATCWITSSGWLNDIFSLLVAMATLLYLSIKIWKEFKKE